MISLEEATRRSVNTVFAQMASELGGEKLASTANRIGIDSEIDPVISLTLGAGAVTPIEIASAYSSFATNGVLAPPYLIERIEDSNGEILYQNIVSQRISIPDPGAAAAVRKTLEVAAQFGTGTRAVLDDRPIAGKTGTHQGFREAWFIGFIPQYTSSVWIGFAEEQLPLTDVEINGEVIRNVSGGRVPAPMWKAFMTKVVEDLPVLEWPNDPSDIEKYYEIPTVMIPELTGLNVLVAEEIAFSNYLLPDITLIDSEEAPGLVLSQSIEIDEEVPEGTVIELEVSGQKFSAPIPSIPPCQLLPEEAENLIKTYMRENNVILFLKKNFESSDIQGCEGKVIGTNVSQGAIMSTGDTLIFIIDDTEIIDDSEDDS
jgi:membrane peptidoglycan carboxypeptidase